MMRAISTRLGGKRAVSFLALFTLFLFLAWWGFTSELSALSWTPSQVSATARRDPETVPTASGGTPSPSKSRLREVSKDAASQSATSVASSDSLRDLRAYLSGAKYLIIQSDDRLASLWSADSEASGAAIPKDLGNFSTLGYTVGPSIIAMSDWAKKNGYAYLFFNKAKGPCYGPLGATDLVFPPPSGWCKVPGILYGLKLAQLGGVTHGVLYVDSDVGPDELAQADDRPTPQSFNLTAIEEWNARRTGEPDFASSAGPHAHHLFLGMERRWWEIMVRRSGVYSPNKLVNNAGAMLMRVTDEAEAILRRWWFVTSKEIIPFDVKGVTSKIALECEGSRHEDTSSQSELLRTFQQLVGPEVEVTSSSPKEFAIVGNRSADALKSAHAKLCPATPSSLPKKRLNSECNVASCTALEFRDSRFNFPGDQGRLQYLVETDDRVAIPDGPFLGSMDGWDKKVFYHWCKEWSIKKLMSKRWSEKQRIQKYGPGFSREEWEASQGWREVRKVPNVEIDAALVGAPTDEVLARGIGAGRFVLRGDWQRWRDAA